MKISRFYRRPLLGIVLLTIVVGVGPAQKQEFDLSFRREPNTRHPVIGVHTRLTDEVEEWKIQKSLVMAREMGANWVTEYFPWCYIETTKGIFDWEHSDMVINHAYSQGLELIARLDCVPDWARPKDTTARYIYDRNIDDFGNFVHAFVNRYKDRVKYFVIWNEPNTTAEWGFRPVSAAEYVNLLRAIYPRIKDADPQANVVAGALAPTLEQGPMGLDDLVYLQQMYNAGAKDYFDVMAIHAYGFRYPPDDPPSPDKVNFARASLIRDVMVQNGDAAKPAIITEGGWNDHPRWTKAVRPAQRVQYTVRAFQKIEQEWPWCLGATMWVFRLPRPARNYNDNYVFVDALFRPKLVYLAVQKYARDEDWQQVMKVGTGGAGSSLP